MLRRTIRILQAAAVLAAITLALAPPAIAGNTSEQAGSGHDSAAVRPLVSARDKQGSDADDPTMDRQAAVQPLVSARDKRGSDADDPALSRQAAVQPLVSAKDKRGSDTDDPALSRQAAVQPLVSAKDKRGSDTDDPALSRQAAVQPLVFAKDKRGSDADDPALSRQAAVQPLVFAKDKRGSDTDDPALSRQAAVQPLVSAKDKRGSDTDDPALSRQAAVLPLVSARDKRGSDADDPALSRQTAVQPLVSAQDKQDIGIDDPVKSSQAAQPLVSAQDKKDTGTNDTVKNSQAAQPLVSAQDKKDTGTDDTVKSSQATTQPLVSAQDKRDAEADTSAQSRQGSDAAQQDDTPSKTGHPAQYQAAAALSETESEAPTETPSEGGQNLISAWYASMHEESENFIFSPYSLLDCVRILYPAADGESLSQIEEILGLNASRAAALQAMDEGMLFENGIGAKSANKAYINTGIPNSDQLHPEVLSTEDVDLSAFDDRTFERINEEIAERTEQKIRDLLSPDNVDADTASVLLNCLYFMNTWDHTECEVSWRGEKDVPGFSDTVSLFQIKEEGDLDILRLPYSNAPLEEDEWGTCLGLPVEGMDRYSLYVICDRDDSPEEKVDEFMKTLTFADLTRLLDFSDYEGLSGYTDAFFKVPEFEVRSRSSLTSLLKSLGMTAPFQPGTTDFQRFGPFWISDILQEAYMKTTHSGTEAAAVTAMVMEAAAAPVETVQVWKNVVADSPFAVILKDDTANEILFIGRIGEPA